MKFIIFLLFQKYIRRGPVDDNPVLVPTMAWHRTGDRPPSEPMMDWFVNAYLDLNESMIRKGGHLDKLVMLTDFGKVPS